MDPAEELRAVAHDLANVFAVVLNYAELVRRRTADPGDAADLDTIRRAATRGIEALGRVRELADDLTGDRTDDHTDDDAGTARPGHRG